MNYYTLVGYVTLNVVREQRCIIYLCRSFPGSRRAGGCWSGAWTRVTRKNRRGEGDSTYDEKVLSIEKR